LSKDFFIRENATECGNCGSSLGLDIWEQVTPDGGLDTIGPDQQIKGMLNALGRHNFDTIFGMLERVNPGPNNQIDTMAAGAFGESCMQVVPPNDPIPAG
jgi:hypothetical protein